MKPLYQFTATEADRWIIEMRRSLAEHAEKLTGTRYPGEVRAAIETHLMLLREMSIVHPIKREEIETLIAPYERP